MSQLLRNYTLISTRFRDEVLLKVVKFLSQVKLVIIFNLVVNKHKRLRSKEGGELLNFWLFCIFQLHRNYCLNAVFYIIF